MIFSFCLNKTDLLIVCGITLLYQAIDLKKESKVMQDNERLVNAVIGIVGRERAPGSWDFRRVASRLITIDEANASVPSPPPPPSREGSTSTPSQRGSPPSAQLRQKSFLGRRPDASVRATDLLQQQERMRRMTMPSLADQKPDLYRSSSRQSFDSVPGETSTRHRDHRLSMSQVQRPQCSKSRIPQNLDYLALGATPSQSRQTSPPRSRMQPPSSIPPRQNRNMPHSQTGSKMPATASSTEWETMLGTMDGGLNNVYDAIYGGTSFLNEASAPTSSQYPGNDWSPDTWDLSTFNIGDFGNGPASNPAAPQSVLSMSDDSLSSGEDVAPSELGLSMGSVDYQGNMVANCGGNDGFILDGLESFPL